MKWKGGALPEQWNQLWERYKYVLMVILVGVILLILPDGDSRSGQQGEPEQNTGFSTQEMEEKLGNALSEISGAGRVTVVLTLQSGSRQILAQDIQSDEKQQKKSTVIISQGSGTEQPVVLQQVSPQYQGALVVCDGGGDPAVKLEIIHAVKVLTGLNSDKISICKRK